MAELNGFNAHDVDPTGLFEPLPSGRYLCVITDSAMKATKDGVGKYLELKFQVLDGEHKGRFLWARLNLHNPNETTVRIAKAQLSSLCRAVNVMQPRDSVELHGLPVVVQVKLRKRKDTDELENQIANFLKKETLSGQPQQAGTNAPPWKRA